MLGPKSRRGEKEKEEGESRWCSFPRWAVEEWVEREGEGERGCHRRGGEKGERGRMLLLGVGNSGGKGR